MAPLIWLANQLLPSTVALSMVTTAIGLCACPLQSAEFQHAFLVLSIVTYLLAAASCVWSLLRPQPHVRRYKLAFGIVPLVGFWCILMLPVQTVREGSARTQTINNGKQIGLAIIGFGEEKRLPADFRFVVGAPIQSWQVNILPYIDELPLHTQFDLMKSWDSPRNRPLVEKIPSTYRSIMFPDAPGDTPWQVFVGPGTAFEPGRDLNLRRDFPDGTGCTILVAEATVQVPWSKPADIAYGPGIPLPPLGQNYLRQGDWPFNCSVCDPGFHVCMADGTVRYVKSDISEKALRGLIERNDGRGQDDLPE
jgi:hypothetical protein